MSGHTGYLNQWVSGPRQHTQQLLHDGVGSFTLVLYWEPRADGVVMWVDFELFEVTSLDADGTLEYSRRGADSLPDPTRDLSEAECAAWGYVKWDGCTSFSMHDVHVDHREDLENLFSAIKQARASCALHMPNSMVHGEYE